MRKANYKCFLYLRNLFRFRLFDACAKEFFHEAHSGTVGGTIAGPEQNNFIFPAQPPAIVAAPAMIDDQYEEPEYLVDRRFLSKVCVEKRFAIVGHRFCRRLRPLSCRSSVGGRIKSH